VCQFVVTVDGLFLARVDFAWPDRRLIVEVDGYEWHSSREAFQRDRERQNRLVQAGWTVLRFTVEDIRQRPELVVTTIQDALQ
jgi:very-short-patch-repair endonuclease